MKILVSMPKEMLESLDRLVRHGLYSSRSEAVREGIRMLFQSMGGGEEEEHEEGGPSPSELEEEGRGYT
jgi:Arc/MetJ-type ribon-helix-helix transcriptional regulator